MPKPGALLDTDTVPDMVLVDMEVTVLALPAMEVTVLDAVSGRDLLMPKLGALLDTDTVPDMVLADMEVTVLALPAMEDTVLDTVSGRDLLMPGMDVDMEVMVDTAVDMEVMVDTDVATADMDTESNSLAQSTCYHLHCYKFIVPSETKSYPFHPKGTTNHSTRFIKN